MAERKSYHTGRGVIVLEQAARNFFQPTSVTRESTSVSLDSSEPASDFEEIKSTLGEMQRSMQALADSAGREHAALLDLGNDTNSNVKALNEKIEKLTIQNKDFREKLQNIYSPRKLLRYSSLGLVFSGSSLLVSSQNIVDLVHPVLAYAGIVASFSFMGIAFALKKDKEKAAAGGASE